MPAPKSPGVPSSSCRARVAGEADCPDREDFGIAGSRLRRWMAHPMSMRAGGKACPSDEKAERVRLRRENRTQAMEIDILAAPTSPGRTCLQNGVPVRS